MLGPPPPDCQASSPLKAPVMGSRLRLVPPTETTLRDADGQITPGLSPEDAK